MDQFNKIQLDAHNVYRGHHATAPLTFSPELASQAYQYACELAIANSDLK